MTAGLYSASVKLRVKMCVNVKYYYLVIYSVLTLGLSIYTSFILILINTSYMIYTDLLNSVCNKAAIALLLLAVAY